MYLLISILLLNLFSILIFAYYLGPDLVVCDEGHILKNEKTSISIAMYRIKTQRRIVLTGTPLQNNLKEYYCMVQFVKPNLLGTYKEYLNRFVNPITNGQYTDSTQRDLSVMRKRAHVLHKLLDGIVQVINISNYVGMIKLRLFYNFSGGIIPCWHHICLQNTSMCYSYP